MSWQIIVLLPKAEVRLWLQSHLRMRSVTKFVLDLKHRNLSLSQSIQKTLISVFSTGISSPNSSLAYQSSTVKEYFCNYQFLWSKKKPPKCCIFIHIRCNFDVHDILRNDPRYLKITPWYYSQRVKMKSQYYMFTLKIENKFTNKLCIISSGVQVNFL